MTARGEGGEAYEWSSSRVEIVEVSSSGLRPGHRELAATIPGADVLIAHYGDFPSFHDAHPAWLAYESLTGVPEARLRLELGELSRPGPDDLVVTLVMGGLSTARAPTGDDLNAWQLDVLGGPGAWEVQIPMSGGEPWRFECETLAIEDIGVART